MMDPLSGAASVIAVVQLAASLVEVCGGYIRKVKHAQQDILDLQREVSSLGDVLGLLHQLLRGPDRQKLSALQNLFDEVTECSSTLKKLNDKIIPDKTQSTPRKWGLRALKWPLQRSEVDEAVSQIERYKSAFSLALKVDQVISAGRIERKLDLDKLKIAQGATFDSYENEHAECLPGTRTELLHQIEEWADSPTAKCIFWLNGKAGTGKSTISRTVASILKVKGSLGASFFFKRGEEDRGNAKRLFPTLIQQLVTNIPQLGPEIQKAIEDNPYISDKALGEQFNKLLLHPLQNTDLDQITTMSIVIDALDECESGESKDNIRSLLQLLPQVQTSKWLKLRFFLTSRPELPIRLGFGNIKDDHQNMDLHDVPTSEITRDIAIFLKHTFLRIQQDHGLSIDWPGVEIINILIAKTTPLFISAATLCRFIGDKNWDPEDRLRNILADRSTYISKMASTYLPILNQLLIGQNKWEAQQLIDEFKKIIGTIVILATPLSINAIAQLLDVNTSKIQKRLNCLHSVLNIPGNLDLPVRTLHLSFRDFLLDTKTKDAEASRRFWIDERLMHQNLTDQCLDIMEHSLRRNICNLPDDSTERSNINMHSINYHLPSGLRYACRYWTQHLIQTQDPNTLLVRAFYFLEVHFLHWLEALSVLGIISEAVAAFKRLQSALKDDQIPIMSEFLSDATRFTLKNRQIADMAPLQLYSSGLIFTPRNALTRQIFKNELSNWCQLPKVQETWGAELQTLEGHSDSIQSVAFSPDGQVLASASNDKTIKLWDPNIGDLCQTLEGHCDSIQSVAFSPDGQVLASASNDKTIKLWDPNIGDLCQTLEGHSDSVQSVAFSPDGQVLASASNDKTIKLWDPITGSLYQTLKGHSQSVLSVAFSPNNQLLASASHDQSIKLWDLMTGDLRQTLETQYDTLNSFLSIAFSSDGQLLASACIYGSIVLWDLTTNNPHQTFEGHSYSVQSVAFSPNSQLLASASQDQTIKIWDPTTADSCHTLEGHYDAIMSVVFSPDGQLLASASDDTMIILWDRTSGDLCQILKGHSNIVESIAFSPDGQLLASASHDKTIKLWNPTTGDLYHTLKGHSGFILSVAFSPDAQVLASASWDKTIKLWDPTTGKLCQTLKGHTDTVRSIAFSPNGQLLASMSSDQTVKLWDSITGDLHQTLKGSSCSALSIAFSSNGQVLASASDDNTIKLWDPTTGELHQTLEGHSDWVRSVAFSPDDQLLVSASTDNTVKLWDPTTGELRQTLEGHSDPIWSEDNVLVTLLRKQWICLQTRQTLWLPTDYRPICLAIKDGVIVQGHMSGKVSFISQFN